MRTLFAAFLLISSLLSGQTKPAAAPEILVLTNVNVIDSRTGNVSSNMTVVIKHRQIDAIAKVGVIAPSHGVKVVNASGKYLIPGLWDMHVHSAGGPAAAWDAKIILPLYIANGVTGIRDMGGDPTLLEPRKESIERGELLGPHMVIAGPFLNGGKSDAQTLGVNTPVEGRAAVDALKKRSVDFIKILSGISREVYFAIAEESAKQKIRFAGHVPDSVSAAEAAEAGQRSIEHLSGILLACSTKEDDLRQQKLAAIIKEDSGAYAAAEIEETETYSPEKAQKLFTQLNDSATWQVPTLIWDHTAGNLDDLMSAPDPRLKYVPASVVKEWQPAKLTSPSRLAQAKKIAAAHIDVARAMQRAGVLLLAGSDGPDPYVFPGFSLHEELGLLVQAGFTRAQALRAATFEPAVFLGKVSQYGSVEKGKAADLVLLDGSPLDDIRNTRKIAAVIVGGRYYSREELDNMLAEAAAVAKTE
ncbi:MAG TPA: amidohydrolase family protein [Terriglobales bacterium]|nr:amidohydrolase family protein [Terriglobales bacterium]